MKNKIVSGIENKYVLLIHCRNPYLNNAGSENLIISHIKLFNERNISSLVVFPINITKMGLNIHRWGMSIEDKFLGVYSTNDIIKIINEINLSSKCKGIFIHSLLFMDFTELYHLVSFRSKVVLYLHDFCTCCSQFNLLKNKEIFCGNARIYDEKCSDCCFYLSAKKMKASAEQFLSSIENVAIIAPSEFVKVLWCDAFPKYADKVTVVNHKKLVGNYSDNMSVIQPDDRLRIAYVGQDIRTKGYDKWLAMTDALRDNYRYEFYHLGRLETQNSHITYREVSIINDGPDAMIKALRELKIHAVVLFSTAPETYSYTYFESLASNCFVITSDISGNIAVETRKRKNGVVLENSTTALLGYLSNTDKVIADINDFRKRNLCGPLALENNDSIVELLNDEKSIPLNPAKKVGKLQTFIAEILYRIRFRV